MRSQNGQLKKPKLDNARRLRGIYFIDPEDKEFKETIKNAKRKLETPIAPAMPCKTCKKNKHAETRGKTNDFKSKYACILEASESTRMRLPKYHEDHIAGKGDNSLQHLNLVHKFIPMRQAMKIPAAKAAVDKEWEKLEKISASDLTRVRNKSQVIDEARTKGITVSSFCLTDGHLSFEKSRIGDKAPKIQRSSCIPRRHCERRSGSYAVFTEQGSSTSQMTAAKVIHIISRLPGCAGQAADAVSAKTQVKTEDDPKINENSKVRMSICLDTSTTTQNGQNHGPDGRPSRSS